MRTLRRSLSASLLGLAALAAGCASPRSSPQERVGAEQQAFDSHGSVLVDFDIEGGLTTDTSDPALVRTLVQAQLLYAVGVLNKDRSLGRYERLELSAVTATPKPGTRSFDVTYRAKLPVAWGVPELPTTYSLPLPARVGQSDQRAFAAKYGTTCVDPSAGEIGAADAGRMFLNFRPQREGCVLDAADIATATATVSPSTENTTGKYPEYHHVWADGALDVVALFSRSSYETTNDDFGVRAYADFAVRLDAYLAGRQPDATKRTVEQSASTLRRTATLPDGRIVRIDAVLVGARLAQEPPAFDAWYDALTPQADVILYSGHADLGENVRTLMKKGTFVPGKYVMWVDNACDTFAYVDRTLAERRAALNPDDVRGTKYLDTVSTVLGGYFGTGPPTTISFLDAMVTARDPTPAPRTYREIFAQLDPDQITVVTGEEDNEFTPALFAAPAPPPDAGPTAPGAPAADAPTPPESGPQPQPQPQSNNGGGCSAVRGVTEHAALGDAAFVAATALLITRLRRRRAS